jgi:hypothetical protein
VRLELDNRLDTPLCVRRWIVTTAAAGVLFCAMPAPLAAQWLHYPSVGVPRTPAGTPDLAAPAPKTPDGKPDLSGIWTMQENRSCPPGGCDDMLASQEFLNIGWSLKGGLPYQPWAAEAVRARTEQYGKDDPQTHCLPIGVVKMHTDLLMRKIVQVPGSVLIINERNTTYRQIFTDGRPLRVDPEPPWIGYSSGKWVGDTLVIETNGFRDGLWLDHNGSPMTDAAKLTERIRRVNYGRLEIELTVDDPKAYTAPWTVKLNQDIVLDTELIDYACLENEKDIPNLVGK